MDNEAEILLVEDDPKDVQLALHALRAGNLGDAVAVCRDGEEALDFLFGRGAYGGRPMPHRPRLVLLDLKLPKVNGLEVLREIKSHPETRAVPVVILTSSKEERDLVEGYRLGVNSYIQKPVDFDRFRETIRTLGLYWLVINQLPPVQSVAAEWRPPVEAPPEAQREAR